MLAMNLRNDPRVQMKVVETIPSPITGADGNREFLLYARRAEHP